MTDLEKAARRALETLEDIFGKNKVDVGAITALRQALEQPAQQKPVGQLMEEAYGRGQVLWFNKPDDLSVLYTSPQRKPWVGLTPRERIMCRSYDPEEAVAKTEAKLKEKNA